MSTTATASTTPTHATAPQRATQRHRDDDVMLPRVDILEDAHGLTLLADLPGVPRELLQLRVDGDQLIIEGETRLDLPEGLRLAHAEVSRPLYRRAFKLSKSLDAGQISAELTQGVLRVRLPKAAHATARKIEVRLS